MLLAYLLGLASLLLLCIAAYHAAAGFSVIAAAVVGVVPSVSGMNDVAGVLFDAGFLLLLGSLPLLVPMLLFASLLLKAGAECQQLLLLASLLVLHN